MSSTKEDDQEDHLEEGDVEVAGREGEPKDPKNGRTSSLDYRHAQRVETRRDPLLRSLVILGHVVVADVRTEVDGEADAHDQVDQGHPVQVHVPPGHVPHHAGLQKDLRIIFLGFLTRYVATQ